MKKIDIANEIINLIDNNYQDKVYFFTKAKSPDYFSILKSRGYFRPCTICAPDSSGLLPSHPWPQVFYLHELAKQIETGEISSKDFIVNFQESIRLIDNIPDDYHLLRQLTEVNFSIPVQYLVEDDIRRIFELVDQVSSPDKLIEFTLYNGFKAISEQLENNDHSLMIIKILFFHLLDYSKIDEASFKEHKLKYFDDYGYKDFLNKTLDLQMLHERNPATVYTLIDAVVARLDALLGESTSLDDSTEYWRPAVPSHQQNAYHDSAPSLLLDLLFTFSIFLLKKNLSLNYIENWEKSRFETYKRLFFALAADFNDVIPPEHAVKVLLEQSLDDGARYERFYFLKNNFDKLDLQSQSSVIEAIRTLKDEYSNNEEEKKVFTAWKQIRWAQALKKSKSQKAQHFYQELYALTGQREADHPEFSTYMSSGWIGPVSPWSIEDFRHSSPKEISDFLINFKGKDKFRGPDENGLARTLEQYVQEEPEKCSALLSNLGEFNYRYVSAIIDGYTKAWGDKKPTPVIELLSAIELYTSLDGFIMNIINKDSRARWVVSSIASFINIGTKNDENSFDIKTAQKCFVILSNLEKSTPEDKDYFNYSDAFTRAINEPRGKIFEAFVILSLRRCRVAGKDTSDFNKAWNDLKSIIERALSNYERDEISLRALIGAYYRQFLFMGNDWIYNNLDLVLSYKNTQKRWLGFMEGFSYVTAYAEKMYNELNVRNMLIPFLRYDDQTRKNQNRLDRLQNRIIDLGLIAYLHGNDDSVIKSVLNEKLPGEWAHLFFSIHAIVKDDAPDELRVKSVDLVKEMFELYDRSNEDFTSDHFSNVNRVLRIFNNPSDQTVKKVFRVSSKYAKGNWDFNNLIDFMEKNVVNYPREVGALYVNLLESTSFFPGWPEDKIHFICNKLNESRESIYLSTICRIYGERSINCEPIRDVCSNIKPKLT